MKLKLKTELNLSDPLQRASLVINQTENHLVKEIKEVTADGFIKK